MASHAFRSLACVLVVFLLGASCATSSEPSGATGSPQAGTDGWIPLFNGRDLSGWTPKISGHPLGEDPGRIFRVEDGVLKVSYDAYERFDGEFGHLFYEAPLTEYRLRIEYRFTGEQLPGGPGWARANSGVMLHGQPPESMGLDQDFPVSIEMQFLGGDGTHERSTANLCTPGTHVVMDGGLETRHCIDSSSETYHGDRWVTVEAEVRSDVVIRHFVEGQLVLEYREPSFDPQDADAQALIGDGGLRLTGGYISLQAESHPLEFRRVEMQPLGVAGTDG